MKEMNDLKKAIKERFDAASDARPCEKAVSCEEDKDEEAEAIGRGIADIEAGRFTESIEEVFEKAAAIRSKKNAISDLMVD